MSKLPYVKKPCKNCPFKKDTMRGWLGKERMTEILGDDSFVCHKTTQGEMKDRRQCAGHMIMKGEDNMFVALAQRIGQPVQLGGQDQVFDSKQDCIDHHSGERR